MKVALDSNILAYAAGLDDLDRQTLAQGIIARIGTRDLVVPQQVAGELYNVLLRKGRHPAAAAVRIVAGWTGLVGSTPSSPAAFADALDLASAHKFQIWDALIVCTAAEAGCDVLLSEDMQHGFQYRGLTIVNPFAETPHPRLRALLQSLPEPRP